MAISWLLWPSLNKDIMKLYDTPNEKFVDHRLNDIKDIVINNCNIPKVVHCDVDIRIWKYKVLV